MNRFPKKKYPANDAQGGFSLMELMVVIAIIAILAAITIPNVVSWRNTSQFNAAVREVKSAIEGVRMAAMKSNLPATLTFNGTNAFSTQTQQLQGGGVVLKPAVNHRMTPGVTVTLQGRNVLTFNNRGMTPFPGTIDVRHTNGMNSQIIVNVTGGSRIQ